MGVGEFSGKNKTCIVCLNMKKKKTEAARQKHNSTAEELAKAESKVTRLLSQCNELLPQNCFLELFLQRGIPPSASSVLASVKSKKGLFQGVYDGIPSSKVVVKKEEELPEEVRLESSPQMTGQHDVGARTTEGALWEEQRTATVSEPAEPSSASGEKPRSSSTGNTEGSYHHVEIGEVEVEVGEVDEVAAMFDWADEKMHEMNAKKKKVEGIGIHAVVVKSEVVRAREDAPKAISAEVKRCTSCRNYLDESK